ncbi:WxL protein peptidoglycan domain-containing protein [Cellulomonas soli]
MTRSTPRAARALLLAALVAAVGALVPTAATADDTTVAWAVSPADEAGNPDGTTRFELEVGPGEQVVEHVLVTNSSTVERTFRVYGADGFTTQSGGYDLGAAAAVASDVGAWVTTEAPTVTIPALESRPVAFTVAVPAGAAPGDHPGGLVVSLDAPQADAAAGVLVDTRVAVRLSVRVPGELAPALEVRDLHVAYGAGLVPFAGADATVSYEVVNTGNVTVLGVPRVRVTGPFGTRLASAEPGSTREVLPGDSLTVTTTLTDVEPAVLATAVVDVTMAAAPGPDTVIPAVSSTARVTFLAVPWSGLVVLGALVSCVVLAVRGWRRRRGGREAAWAAAVHEAAVRESAAREVAAGQAVARDDEGAPVGSVAVPALETRQPRALAGPGTLALVLLGLLTAAGTVAAPAPAVAVEHVRSASPDGDGGELRLQVPPAPAPSASGGTQAVAPAPAPAAGVSSGALRPRGSRTSVAPSAGDPVAAQEAAPAPAQAAQDPGGPRVAIPTPDLVWRAATADGRRTAVVLGAGGTAAAGGAWLVYRLVAGRRGWLA